MQHRHNTAFLVIFCTSLAWAAGQDKPPSLETLGLAPEEFSLPKGWPLPHTIAAVEDFYKAPLSVPNVSKNWLDRIDASTESLALFGLAAEILGTPVDPEPLSDFKAALRRAQPLLNAAVNSVSPKDRAAFLPLMDWPDESTGFVKQDISAKSIKKKFAAMERFNQKDLLLAAALVMAAADQLIRTPPAGPPQKIKTPQGWIVIAGPGDDVYTDETLKDVALLVDLGGRNTYTAPAAAAREKQIHVVIDFGTDITIRHDTNRAGTFASGVFGIGLFYAPNSSGKKDITSGSFSQGCGLAGVGGLFLSGESHLIGDRYVQGAGSFGVGILETKNGAGSSYLANRSGQGAGFTRGVGLFRHNGDNARIHGGLVQPDPREPQGAVSVCQGVGFGRRAYTGGGVGIAAVAGNGIEVVGSYFAQGCGYWHALGIFHLRGDRSTLQARRYALGSGVHSAFGHLEVEGQENRVLNWGVGPAYGWDRGLGSFRLRGNKNEIQADWGTGTASIGSLSFSQISGNGNRLKIPQYGSGGFFNDEFSYAFHDIDGAGTEIQFDAEAAAPGDVFLMPNPWGVARVKGARFVKDLKLTKPVWPDLPQEPVRERERVDLQGIVRTAQTKSTLEKTADLLDVASAFSLDRDTPRSALEKLLLLPDKDAKALVDILEPAATDQLIRLRIVMAAFGEAALEPMLAAYAGATAQEKGIFLSLTSRMDPRRSLPFLFEQSFGTGRRIDERLRPGAIRNLGFVLNRDSGQEPGMRAVMETLAAFVLNPEPRKKETENLLSRLRLTEAYGVLSAATELAAENRAALLKAGPKDVSEPIGASGAAEMTRQILAQPAARARIEKTLADIAQYAPKVRGQLHQHLESTTTATIAVAVMVLGQMAAPDDAARLASFITHPKAAVRHAAAVALGRMGDAGLNALEEIYSSTETSRRTVMAALPHAVSKRSSELLMKGLQDKDPIVRLQALSVFGSLPPVLEEERPELIQRAKKILEKETDVSVRLAAGVLN